MATNLTEGERLALTALDDFAEEKRAAWVDATTARNDAVLALVEDDRSQSDIARLLGVTPGRVSQIVATARARREAAAAVAA